MSRFLVHEVPVVGRPGTHVLIIGVGRYPHLIGGETPCQNPDGMGQLSSPPISARELAAWFVAGYNDPGKELASVALLLSEADPQPFRNPKTNEPFDIEDATGDNAEAAIREWRDRADSDPGNRLFFYFCGHGVCEGEDMALLTSDFCSDDHNPLQGAIDFRRLRGGLKKCKASEQVFFIDACRANSDVLIGDSDGWAGRVPLLPGRRPADLPRELAVPYYATLAGDQAYARENSVSLFTEALLRSLRGAASDDPEGPAGDWRVNTTRLQEAIDHFMKEPVFAGAIAGVQVPVAGQLPVFVFHRLTGPPEVPVYVGCEAPGDNALAEFVCLQGGAERARRALADVDPADPQREWSLPLPFGDYGFRAEVAAEGQPRSIDSFGVRPVSRRVRLEATQ
jgi:hypothetical protein